MMNDERKMKNKYSDMINRLLTLNFFAMRKLYVYVAMFAIGTMAACQKNNDVNPQGGNDGVIDDNSPVAVQLGVSGIDISVSPKSKALGGVDAWNSHALKIYAFDRTVADFSNPYVTAFINNVDATAPEAGDPDPITSGQITLLNPASEAQPKEPFYYEGTTVYDFYGYYMDDAQPANTYPDTTATGISVPFEIDGTQDLMVAKANPEADVRGTEVAAANAYSAYAARRDIQPTLRFKHELSRFTFHIVAGASGGENVLIDSVIVYSKYKGDLRVVDADSTKLGIDAATVENEVTKFYLKESAAAGGLQELTPVKPDAYTETRDNFKKIGESIMVIPGEVEYELAVYTSDENIKTPMKAMTPKIALGTGEAFEKGKYYEVKLYIYGLEKVEVKADLVEWEDGGDITIDPDQMPVEEDDEEEQGGQDDQEQGGPQEP